MRRTGGHRCWAAGWAAGWAADADGRSDYGWSYGFRGLRRDPLAQLGEEYV